MYRIEMTLEGGEDEEADLAVDGFTTPTEARAWLDERATRMELRDYGRLRSAAVIDNATNERYGWLTRHGWDWPEQ